MNLPRLFASVFAGGSRKVEYELEAIGAGFTSVVCVGCVRPSEPTRDGTFGDFGLCERCKRSVTSADPACRVRRH